MTFMNYSRWPKAVESELGRGGKWEWHGGSGQTCGDSSAFVASNVIIVIKPDQKLI
jgi:hypothetical protein